MGIHFFTFCYFLQVFWSWQKAREYSSLWHFKNHYSSMDEEGESNLNTTRLSNRQRRLNVGQGIERKRYSEEVVYTHVCKKCGKFFTGQQLLDEHLKTHIDYNDQLYKCFYCQKSYNDLKYLQRHQKEKHICSHCGDCFRKTSALLKHQTSHLPRPHPCLKCGKRFRLKADLKSHCREKHPPPVRKP